MPHPDPKCLIIDDCTLHRENLAAVFVRHGRSRPAVAWDVPSLFTALRDAIPDIVLVNMDIRDSVAMLRLVKQHCLECKVIVVAVDEDDESEIIKCAEAGVDGYHLKTETLDDLLALMSRVASGESLCSPRVSAILLKRLSALAAQRNTKSDEVPLTTREIQILGMLETGLSNRDIADQLCIALHTVKNHVHSVLGKLGVSSRAEAAALSRSTHHAVHETRSEYEPPIRMSARLEKRSRPHVGGKRSGRAY
ncbi:LuxR C-terminal-related transcriptional regulator [Mycobacterium sp. URHB0021]